MGLSRIGLLQSQTRETLEPSVRAAAEKLRALGVEVLSDRAELTNKVLPRQEIVCTSDALIVCGGDGTILSSARMAAVHGVPVLGVNFGQLGFLSEVEAAGMEQAVVRLREGRFTIERRLMLRAECQGREVTALNDIVIRRESALAVVRADVCVDGGMLDHYVADGILVSTPTGASAYALSCGGPIVHPKLRCLTLMAICPHSLRARPVLLAPEQRIEVTLAQRSLPAMICADGQDIIPMETGEPVVITRSLFEAQFIRFDEMQFFSKVHAKLVDRTEASV